MLGPGVLTTMSSACWHSRTARVPLSGATQRAVTSNVPSVMAAVELATGKVVVTPKGANPAQMLRKGNHYSALCHMRHMLEIEEELFRHARLRAQVEPEQARVA